jgi:phosphomannomutase
MSTPPPGAPREPPLLRALGQGDPLAAAALANTAFRLRPSRLIERPWGGERLADFTGLTAPEGSRVGEAFLVAAWADDPEAMANPSIAELPDGSELPLPALLEAAGDVILGPAHLRRFGPGWPLLPKLLDVGALLSVQAHPPGQPEVYVVLAADPGATVALGFARDLDRERLRGRLAKGHAIQRDLVAALRSPSDEPALQDLLAPWLADEEAPASAVLPALAPMLAEPGLEVDLATALEQLRRVHHDLLGAMHHIPVRPGMVLYNRQLALPPAGQLPSADVHALGNPQGRGVLLLELRLPGGTLRAWDHARFPRRRIDLDQALDALPLRATPIGFFHVQPRPLPQRPGVLRSVECGLFAVDHLRPGGAASIPLPALTSASTLHSLRGFAQLYDAQGQLLHELVPGDTLLLPRGLATTLRSQLTHTEILHVTLPSDEDHHSSDAVTSSAPSHGVRRPVELAFGTSGLRGLVVDMTDREVYINTAGFVDFLERSGDLPPGAPLAVGEDLRARCSATGMESSPRIARAVARAAADAGHPVINCGQLPTPALAYWASLDQPSLGKRPMPAVMITGSHIPGDRNGVKFYRLHGEVLKTDEPSILEAVARARARIDAEPVGAGRFDQDHAFRQAPGALPVTPAARQAYMQRTLSCFEGQRPLAGKKLLFFEHTAVGRELIPSLLEALGAEVLRLGRSDDFVPIDTEDLGGEALERFAGLVRSHRAFALVSTDGDSDRPLLIDERGGFQRGDMLGLVTALYLGADFAAVPVSTNDAVDRHLAALATDGAPTVALAKTRIGSPWVIAAMQQAQADGAARVVGWEANGGFLLGSALPLGTGRLLPLPTRDAVLPLLAALVSAAQRGIPVSAVFDELPRRAATAALIDGVPPALSRAIIASLAPAGLADHAAIGRAFAAIPGLGELRWTETMDGLRMGFASGEIVHLRPSGNAPQLRCYAVADTRERAEGLLDRTLRDEDSVIARLEGGLAAACWSPKG